MKLLRTLFVAVFAAALFTAPALADDEAPQPRRQRAAKIRKGPTQGLAQRGPQARGPRAERMQRMQRMQRFQRQGAGREAFAQRGFRGRGGLHAGRGQARHAPAALFQRLDRNGDGVLDRREFQVFVQRVAAAHRAGMGKAGRGETGRGKARMGHARMGRAGMGEAARGQAARGGAQRGPGRQALAGQGHARRDVAGKLGRSGQNVARKGPRASEPQERGLRAQRAAILYRLRQADTNGDGQLSRAEAPPILGQHFDRLDRNEDGQLDKGELQKALKRLGSEAGKQDAGKKAGKRAGKQAKNPRKARRAPRDV